LAELEARGLRDETVIIVTADHGGHGTIHGSSLPEDMIIPWIAAGPAIQPTQLVTPVHIMDTAQPRHMRWRIIHSNGMGRRACL